MKWLPVKPDSELVITVDPPFWTRYRTVLTGPGPVIRISEKSPKFHEIYVSSGKCIQIGVKDVKPKLLSKHKSINIYQSFQTELSQRQKQPRTDEPSSNRNIFADSKLQVRVHSKIL